MQCPKSPGAKLTSWAGLANKRTGVIGIIHHLDRPGMLGRGTLDSIHMFMIAYVSIAKPTTRAIPGISGGRRVRGKVETEAVVRSRAKVNESDLPIHPWYRLTDLLTLLRDSRASSS